jgi:predicted nuclease of predicted toxin-antitoxin system
MKLLVDMNLSPRWVALLNAQDMAAVHWSSLGRMDAPDSEIMEFAAAHDYAVLTSARFLPPRMGKNPALCKSVRMT